jgi:hypothetical protein
MILFVIKHTSKCSSFILVLILSIKTKQLAVISEVAVSKISQNACRKSYRKKGEMLCMSMILIPTLENKYIMHYACAEYSYL